MAAAIALGSSVGWLGWRRTESAALEAEVLLRKAAHDAALPGDQDQVLVAHELGDGRDHFRGEAGGDGGQHRRIGLVGEEPVAEATDRQAGDRGKGGRVVGVDDQARDRVGFVRDHGLGEEARERDVGEAELGGDALFRRGGGQAGQFIARATRRRPPQQFAQGVERVMPTADRAGPAFHGSTARENGWSVNIRPGRRCSERVTFPVAGQKCSVCIPGMFSPDNLLRWG